MTFKEYRDKSEKIKRQIIQAETEESILTGEIDKLKKQLLDDFGIDDYTKIPEIISGINDEIESQTEEISVIIAKWEE